MKKLFILFSVFILSACSHVDEHIIGYNDKGQTLVKVCRSRGNIGHAFAFGSRCTIELRDYGKVTKNARTVNIVTDEKN